MPNVTHYDPQSAPDAGGWLRLDESERVDLVLRHRDARVRLPNAYLHATIHVVVENQLALGDQFPAHRTLERLQLEGLDRHDAVHAIGSVLAKHMYDLLKGGPPAGDPNEPYRKALEALTAESWRHAR
jgi:hypothetical protein